MKYVGIHCDYWNGTGAEKDFRRAFSYTAATGAEAVDFRTTSILSASAGERGEIRRAAEECHLRLTLNGSVPGADLSSPDPAVRADAVDACKKAIEATAEVGASVWTGVIYTKWLDLPDYIFTKQKRREMWDRAVESCRRVGEYAEQFGVFVTFEVCNRFEVYMITTIEAGIQFVKDIGLPSVKILPDLFHMNIEEDSVSDALQMALDSGYTAHIHMSEGNRRLPGINKSDLPWNDIFRIIRASDFDGSIILEPMVLMGAPMSKAFHVWRNMTEMPTVENMIEEARRSIAFVKTGICGME